MKKKKKINRAELQLIFFAFLAFIGHLMVFKDRQETREVEGSWEDMQLESPSVVARHCLVFPVAVLIVNWND